MMLGSASEIVVYIMTIHRLLIMQYIHTTFRCSVCMSSSSPLLFFGELCLADKRLIKNGSKPNQLGINRPQHQQVI